MSKYPDEVESMMLALYQSLDEASRRRYAALEAERMGHGGLAYIESLFGCTYKTIVKGGEELRGESAMVQGRVRRQGGGAKSKADNPLVMAALEEVLAEHTAGSPMDEGLRWTYLNPGEITELMKAKGVQVSKSVVRKLLKIAGFVKRKSQKNKAMGESGERNAQFENVQKVVERHQKKGDAVISMDTKKRSR
jgi:Rhodopirellula transposase DDE domain